MPASSFALIAVLALTGPLDTGRPGTSRPGDSAQLKHCLVSLIAEVQAPAQEAGALLSVAVKEGDVVQVGQPLAQLDDRQAQVQKQAAELERSAAEAKANDDIEVKFAVASFDVADAELQQSLDINRRSPGTVSASDIRRLTLAKRRAELQIDKCKLDLKVAKMTAEVQEAAVKATEQAILRRKVLSAVDGVVVAVYRQTGDWVNAGEPVCHVVRMDRLRVEGFLSAADYDPGEIDGRPVTIEVDLARGRKAQFRGHVVFVSPLLQAGNKYRVRAEVENRQEAGQWLLRSGGTANMAIHLK
jgi:multidrug efflux pump subunit AcrA (membrane-fusion protein)